MEAAIKGMKLAEPTIDPFKVISCPKSHDLILQHFTRNEVKELFLVSKEWNKIVSASSASMKKFELRLMDKHKTWDETSQEKFEGLMKSQRRYSKMKAFFENNTNIERNMLSLEKFSQSLVELCLSVFSEELVGYAPRQLKFPKLKELSLHNYAHELLPSMETNFLISFKVSYAKDDHSEHISVFLKKQHRLKRLELYCSNHFLEQAALSDVPFALKNLTLAISGGISDDDEISPTARLNLHSFLRSMSGSLENLEFAWPSSEDIQLVVNELPKLRRLCTNIFDSEIPNLERNTSITELDLNFIAITIPKNVILSLENLRILTVGQKYNLQCFNLEEDFKWIFKKALKLEVLRCSFFQVDEVRAFYQLLKTQDDSINKNINIGLCIESKQR